MAPIVSARTKSPDNNNSSSNSARDALDKTVGNNRVRTTASREKPSAPKTKTDDPATEAQVTKKPTSSASSTRSSSSAGSSSSSSSSSRARATSSRSATGAAGKQAETSSQHRKERVKTPPTTSVAAATADANAASSKPVKTHPLPSSLLNKHKQASVFTTGKKKHKTNFGSAYDAGSIPCRINHGGIKNALQWTKAPETLDFNPLLITCVEGFQEVEHPFVFLARTAFKDLMKCEDAALEATRILSDAVEGEMNVYLPKLTQQIHRKLLTKQLRAEVEETLATLERNGGKEALAIIRSKIPTYVSVNF